MKAGIKHLVKAFFKMFYTNLIFVKCLMNRVLNPFYLGAFNESDHL